MNYTQLSVIPLNASLSFENLDYEIAKNSDEIKILS